MMTVGFKLQYMTGDLDHQSLIKNIGNVIDQCNYKIVHQTDDEIKFKPYGPEPVSPNDAMFYISHGNFKILNGNLKFEYAISYSAEFLALVLLIPAGIFIDYIGFVFAVIAVLSFLYRIFKIKKHAKEMFFSVF